MFCFADSNLVSLSPSVSICSLATVLHCLERFVIGLVAVRAFLSAVLRQYCLERFVIPAVLWQYCLERFVIPAVLWQYYLERSSLLSCVNSVAHQLSNNKSRNFICFVMVFIWHFGVL